MLTSKPSIVNFVASCESDILAYFFLNMRVWDLELKPAKRNCYIYIYPQNIKPHKLKWWFKSLPFLQTGDNQPKFQITTLQSYNIHKIWKKQPSI